MTIQKNEEPQVTVRFSPNVYVGLLAYADRNKVDPGEAVEEIVRKRVTDKNDDLISDERRTQIEEEAKLMAVVDAKVAGYQQTGKWDEHVTGRVFGQIRDEDIETYARAVGCDPFTFGHPEKARINKRIGARIKRLLGADVIMTGKRREKGQPSRTEKSLILSYTLLTKGSRPRHARSNRA
ncbi:MAG TPA: hypothetical protein VK591_16635 [Xanthobacteraceae bacterium]|nr:hypothetical protein [Xanthobacteraceae bacterium]